jgi:hypothetical protein
MFGVIHMDASGDDNPPLESLPSLYDELYSTGIEDGSVAVINDESGWCLSASRDHRIRFEQIGAPGTARHMKPVSKDRVLELWRRLIAGDIDGLLAEPWKLGYM